MDSVGVGVLLTVHGEIVNPHNANPDLDHVLTLDQSFVLRRTSAITDVQDEETDVNNGYVTVSFVHFICAMRVFFSRSYSSDTCANSVIFCIVWWEHSFTQLFFVSLACFLVTDGLILFLRLCYRFGKNVSCVWPLVAVSHQMTVRAMPFLSAEKLEEALPWVREVFWPCLCGRAPLILFILLHISCPGRLHHHFALIILSFHSVHELYKKWYNIIVLIVLFY